MKVVKSPLEAHALVRHWHDEQLPIGLVPTMGALHEGHFSLVKRSLQVADRTAATIFVNPKQFGPQEDLSKYPRTLDDDLQGLHDLGVDLVFTPDESTLYPPGFSTYVAPPAIGRPWEGEFRPDHFGGVTTVVMKLFQILPATVAYFGQKDYQQWLVIRDMVRDLNVPIRVESCPIVREPDGLAMSSRNRYLSTENREAAVGLWQSLCRVQDLFNQGDFDPKSLEQEMVAVLECRVDAIDYACVVDADTLGELPVIADRAVALVAARIGGTRLIDNILLERADIN